MDDIFGRIVAGILAAFVLIFLPLTVVSLKNENTAQAYIQNEIVRFIDDARATGSISVEAYEDLCYTIDKLQPLCEIKIVHSESYEVTEDGYTDVYYYEYHTNEVLDSMYADEKGRYRMKQGDFIKISVHNTTPTLATRLYRVINFSYHNDTTIFCTYSGYVGNDAG